MTRDQAYSFLLTLVKNQTLIKHHLALEAIMGALCKVFVPNATNELVEKWKLTGLLHDADYEITQDKPYRHTLELEERLGNSIPADIIYAIKAHNLGYTKVEPKSKMDFALFCSDELAGFIFECALSHPEKKLSALTVSYVMDKFNDKKFMEQANRAQIKTCEGRLEISLEQFIRTSLYAMQSISASLGL